ncbi:MAG: 2-oxo-4-hydroxy-4-carboxy-5-ureidoimidazoline decarboxylase [Chloroflexi bacterium]|nr:MAG: 2-oxo-4-hydroxy-4-carboxy-5-ureidoimidazoline decarboxylase [Chloroflexota bacterium]
MSNGLQRFNHLQKDEASLALYATFAHHTWAAEVAAARPYTDLNALFAAAEQAWEGLDAAGWLEAFKAHPRIGERGGHSPAASEQEQSRVVQAAAETLAALAEENRLYEERFGFVFLIAAAGKTAEEILAELLRRMDSDRETELAQAADEHRKITRMRLQKMVET